MIAENLSVMAGADFVAGFMFGMTGDNNLTEIEACYTGGTLMVSEIETGINDIKLGGWNYDTQAALEFGLVALQIPQSLSTCEGMDEDIAAIESWASIFKNPTELAATVSKHYLFHKTEIKADIAAVTSDWDTGLYFKAGQDLADLMTVAIGPIESSSNDSAASTILSDFTAGLMASETGHNPIEELRTCMSGIPSFEHDLTEAIGQLKTGQTVTGVEMFGYLLDSIVDALTDCEDLASDGILALKS